MIERSEQEIMENWKGNTAKPLVSICTITYNHEAYIAEALDSFLMQETDFPFEIVVDDDCSPDATAEVIKKYMKKYPHIINAQLRSKNVGMMKNYTDSMQRAKGKYIALCEGDDYWTDPLKLQTQINFLEKHDEYVITYTSVEAFDENGIVEDYIGGATQDLDKDELQRTTPINTLTTCFRNIFHDVPIEFQLAKYGDLFTWSLLGAYGKGKFLADISPSRYRMHEGGVHSKQSGEVRSEMWSLTFAALYLYHSRVGNKETAEHFKKLILGPDPYNNLLEGLSTKKITKLTFKIIRRRLRQKVKSYLR